jgi:hypothetical protein
MRPTAFVVMETGSDWPTWLVRQDVDVVTVLDRGADEGNPTRAVRERIMRLGRPIPMAVLTCNAEADDVAMDRRVALTRALLAAILEAERGHLIIHAAGRSTASLRHHLIGLTATISEGIHGTSACVSLRFGGAPVARGPLQESHPPPYLSGVSEPAVA